MIDAVDLSHCRVLLVNDVQSNLDVLVETLQGLHLVSVALDGESALKSIFRSPPDLVLLDLMMPGIDGYEVCRRIRANPATHDLPVVFLSTLGEAKSKARGFEAGGTDYVVKPFEALEVRARVRALLKAKMYQDTVRATLAGELRVARQIQRGMVPDDFVTLSLGLPVELFALLEPAEEVGGDLYDVFLLGDGLVCIVLGDVSGKGIPSALFMAVTITLVRATARHVKQPEEILEHVNQELARDNPMSMFVTLFCAVLDTKSGQLSWANGGHPAPALVRQGNPPRWLEEVPGPPIGRTASLTFSRRVLQLEPGDALFLFTDGATGAPDPAHVPFGEERLLAALKSAPAVAKEMIDHVRAVVRAHAGGEPPSDDLALLALRWLPSPA